MNYLALLHIFQHVAATAQANCGNGALDCSTGLPVVDAGSKQIQQILQIVFGIMAAIAVLMIVISGLRFVIAQGNPQEVAKARGTIIYAIVGLVVALTAEGIVALVVDKL